ncbi:MAG TPA: MBL fold metallo-hydrolase [Verrucomicrobiae bacterium]|nr:MBL fold metallo-hydrolase [Verrucomicrobiae bacterium]
MKPVSFHILVPIFVAAITGTLHGQQRDFATVQIKAIPVAGNIHMLEGSGGNIAVSTGPDGVLIVDDQFLPLAEKISAAIEKLDQGPIKYVLNTHWHGDHTGGNAHFGKKASIVAQANVRKRLADRSDTPKEALPVITFENGASVHFNGEEIRIIYLGPAHTDGDCIIHFTKSGVFHLGDQFVNARFPFVDLGSGGDFAGLLKNIEHILSIIPPDAKIIPGHGALATRADLVAFRDMMVETITLVKKAQAEGKTLADVKAIGLPEKYKDWGAGFINASRWLEISFNSLAKK